MSTPRSRIRTLFESDTHYRGYNQKELHEICGVEKRIVKRTIGEMIQANEIILKDPSGFPRFDIDDKKIAYIRNHFSQTGECKINSCLAKCVLVPTSECSVSGHPSKEIKAECTININNSFYDVFVDNILMDDERINEIWVGIHLLCPYAIPKENKWLLFNGETTTDEAEETE
jgi:hypothetical protein